MAKTKRIRSKRKHDNEIMRHIRMGNIDKALETVAKDPNDSILKFAQRRVIPILKKIKK
jgi:hypothetical protein